MKEKLEKIIKTYGVNMQQRKFVEEVFELEEAITIFEKDIIDNILNPTLLEKDIKHLVEEIADVLVLLEQFRVYYNIDLTELKEIARYKINRQILRIEEAENGK